MSFCILKTSREVRGAGPDTPQTPAGVNSWPRPGLPHHRLSTTLQHPRPQDLSDMFQAEHTETLVSQPGSAGGQQDPGLRAALT